MSTTDFFIDALTRRQIFLQRYADGKTAELNEYLLDLIDRLSDRLERETLSQQEIARVQLLISDLQNITNDELGNLLDDLQTELISLAENESDFVVDMMNRGVSIDINRPAPSVIQNLFTTAPIELVQGQREQRLTLSQMFESFSESRSNEIRQIVNDALLTGRTSQQVVRDISERVRGRTKQQIGALIRTSVNHITSQARKSTYLENSDVIEKERFVATLDSHTTITCMSLDGNKYEVGQGPMPPVHWGCRSVRIPIVNPLYTVKIERKRASQDGPVSAKTTYAGWLRKQSKEFQDEVLGMERAKLFRSGKIALDKFTDDKGVVYTLDQLKALNPLAFN